MNCDNGVESQMGNCGLSSFMNKGFIDGLSLSVFSHSTRRKIVVQKKSAIFGIIVCPQRRLSRRLNYAERFGAQSNIIP